MTFVIEERIKNMAGSPAGNLESGASPNPAELVI
jgi:hypothetical protein